MPEDRVELTPAEAACLKGLRCGASLKSRVAVEARLDLIRANRALWQLARKGLAVAASGRPGEPTRWRPSELGELAAVVTVESLGRKRWSRETTLRQGTSAERLLQHLDRPKRLIALAKDLEISRQRAHQNIVRLLALGLIRSADPEQPTRTVARADDPTSLLRIPGERTLSAFPDHAATTTASLSRRLKLPRESAGKAIDCLIAQGLVGRSGEIAGDPFYQLTPAGAGHCQRDPAATRADPTALPVKSGRVRSVLAYLASNGPTRIVTIGRDLDVARDSMNALMQYLKRRGLVTKAGDNLAAPHQLTPEGRRVLDEMRRRAGPG
jgi:DNA-binding MarR family transcriptional regulator